MITSIAFIGGLVAVAVGTWTGSWMLRRRGHRALRSWTVGAAVLLTLLTAADVVNAHFGYLPRSEDVVGLPTWPTAGAAELAVVPPAAERHHPQGAVVDVDLAGPVSGFGTHRALVYLPPQYFDEPARRFPVAYLLHGSPGTPIDWFRSDRAADVGLAAARAGHPVILVAPRASRSWWSDSECVDGAHGRVETYLTTDVVAGVDGRFRTEPTRQDRAVVGNSAGGYCALNLGLRHRQEFGTVVDMSGYTRPTFDGGMSALFGRRPDLAPVVAANTPTAYAPLLTADPVTQIWFDVGSADALPRTEIASIAPVLRNRGEHVTLHVRPGGHVHQVWRAALRDSILSFAASSADPPGAPPVGGGGTAAEAAGVLPVRG